MAVCILVEIYRRFGGTCCSILGYDFTLMVRRLWTYTVRMEAALSSEMSVIYAGLHVRISEGGCLQCERCFLYVRAFLHESEVQLGTFVSD